MRPIPRFRPWLAALLGACLFVSGCAATHARRPASEPLVHVQGVKDVTVAEARALSDAGVMVLDVREPHEFQEGHVPGALNRPLGALDTWSRELDPAGAYVIICRSGKRSAQATRQLESRGFRNLRNVTGGMLSWEKDAHPIER